MPTWRELPKGDASLQGGDKLTLLKPAGAWNPPRSAMCRRAGFAHARSDVDDATQIPALKTVEGGRQSRRGRTRLPASGVEADPALRPKAS